MTLRNNILTINNREYATIKDFIFDVDTPFTEEDSASVKQMLTLFLDETSIKPKKFDYLDEMTLMTWHDIALLPQEEQHDTIAGILATRIQFQGIYNMSRTCNIVQNAREFTESVEFPGLTYLHDQQASSTIILQSDNHDEEIIMKTTFGH